MAGPGNILIKIGAEAGQAIRELSTVEKSLGSTMSKSEKMGAGLKKAALPAAAALGAIGFAAIGATKAAAADAAAQQKLAGVLERTTGANAEAVKATEDWISSTSRATGVADDELRPAFETLVTATGDVSKAQADMTAALDISAASGKSVEDVSKAIALAHTGQTAKLEKLVPGLSSAAKESDNMATIMGELADKTGGAMAKSTDTAAGQMKIMENQTAELQESLGMALLPVIEALLPLFVALGDYAAENTGVIKILVAIVAVLAGAILAANAAMKLYAFWGKVTAAATKVWTAAQWLFNAAMSANPLALVVIAVAALGVAFVIAYKKSETFRDIVGSALDVVTVAIDAVTDAFDAVLKGAKAAFDWITGHWKLALFALGPIGAAIYLITGNFDKVKAAAAKAFDAITGAWKLAKFAFGPIQTAVNAVKGAFDAVLTAATSAFNYVTGAWKLAKFAFGPIDTAITGIRDAFKSVKHWADTAYTYITGAFKIANFAFGPIQTAVQAIANAFESMWKWAKKALKVIQDLIEWIDKIDFPSAPGWLHLPGRGRMAAPSLTFAGAPSMARAGAAPAATSSAGGHTFNIYGAVDPEGTARAIRRLLERHDRRQGRAR